MKLRHAAALALVGWYLMVPPTIGNPPVPNPDAPLSQWATRSAYDKAVDCEREKVRANALIEATPAPGIFTSEALRKIGAKKVFAQCVGTDDPRLKGN